MNLAVGPIKINFNIDLRLMVCDIPGNIEFFLLM